jgi:putative peptidoglycan lipid II flippase
MSLARNTLVQSGLTLGSRILGFARDLLLTARLGQGPVSDAFVTALMFPNLFRRLFAEGAFAQAFVPAYARIEAEHGREAAARVASEAMSFLIAAAGAFCILAMVAMPWLMIGLLSEYRARPDIMALAVLLTQITMPYLICMTIASLLSGVLNTAGKFALTAAAPTLLNIATLIAFFFWPRPEEAARAAAIAVTVAGVAQAGVLWWAVGRQKVSVRLGLPRLTADVRRILALAIPGVIAGGATQINSLTSQVLTGADEGARTVLYNADRLYQLPLGLVGVAIGLALVPRLAKAFALNDETGAQKSMDDGIGLSMALTIPAAAALGVMPAFIMEAVFVRGAFTVEDAQRVADVLVHFAWGVPAFVLAKVFTPPFFARQDTKTPMTFALWTVAANTVLGVALFFGLRTQGVDGVIGLAIATSAAAWLNIVLLTGRLASTGTYRIGRPVWSRLARITAATAIMAAAMAAAQHWRADLYELFWRKELAILIACLGGAALYGLAALATCAVTIAEIRSTLKRERGAPAMPDGGEL